MSEQFSYSRFDLSHTLLRLFLGAVLLLHGVAKLTHGIDPIANMLAGMGLPQIFAYGVYVGEVIAPALLLAGRFVRPAAIIIAINMAVAVGLAHAPQIFALGKSGGWAIELQAFYFIAAVVVAIQASAGSVLTVARRTKPLITRQDA